MKKLRRLNELWSFLPAFRAAAETEHLPSAAEGLGITAPAVSRSIKLLEEQMGCALFERRGRRIVLSDAGATFLSHLRDAMRLLDDAIERISGSMQEGNIRVAANGALAELILLPAMQALTAKHPKLAPAVSEQDNKETYTELLTGRLDVLVSCQPKPHEDLNVERLTDLYYSIYCPEGHPLQDKKNLSMEEVVAHPFVSTSKNSDDGWPPEIDRKTALEVWANDVLPHVCSTGNYLVMLPEKRAERTNLCKVDAPIRPMQTVYSIFRKPLGPENRTGLAVAAIKQVGEALSRN